MDKGKGKRRYHETTGKTVSWTHVDAEQIRDTITAVSGTGCAIRFGYSRDNGAYCIGIIGDGEPYTVWAASIEEVNAKLGDLERSFNGPTEVTEPVSSRKKPM